jgi:ParB family transcriptional regulator, chromosome partitioning protein
MASKLDLLKIRLNENQARHRNAHSQVDLVTDASIEMIPLEHIEVNPFQPRITFTQSEITSLAESIESDGLLQPITVRPNGVKGYQLICGERRFRATQFLNKTHIKAFIIAKNDLESARAALAENVQRANLSDFEVSEGIKDIQQLMQAEDPEKKISKAALRRAVGLSQAALYRCLAFHQLPHQVLEYLHADTRLFAGTVAENLNKALKEAQTQGNYDLCLQILPSLLEALVQGELTQSVLVSSMLKKVKNVQNDPTTSSLSSNDQALQDQLQSTLKLGKKKIGKMEIKGEYWQIKLKYQSLSSGQLKKLRLAFDEILQSDL